VGDPPRILVVDDTLENREILTMRLVSCGYEVITAVDGEDGLAKIREFLPDLILLDVMMPKLDGFEVCRRVRNDTRLPFMPIILVTAKSDTKDIVYGLEAGGDDYLTKPVDQAALMARVSSMLRIKKLHDQVQAQAQELADWNQKLEERVAAQLSEINRIGRLKRFLPPQVAEMIGRGDDEVLKSHRRDIVAVMCDLRGFTSFAETGEPEDVMALLQEYHRAVVPIVFRHEGTLERFMGDGVLVFFNDPLPCEDPVRRAVIMAHEMCQAVGDLAQFWHQRGGSIGFGVGIAQGYATIGQVGFEGRVEYSAIGTVTNLAARICAEALNGQILVSQRIANAAEEFAELSPPQELILKGLSKPIQVYYVVGLRP
jgi:class 3 adenylate cyclase/CheY-like chemotaxis protein